MGPLMGRDPMSAAEQAQHARLALPRGSDADQILRYGGAIERGLFRALQHLERLQRRRLSDEGQVTSDKKDLPRRSREVGDEQEGNQDHRDEGQVTQRKPPGRLSGENGAMAVSGSDQRVAFSTEPASLDPIAPNSGTVWQETLSEGVREQPPATNNSRVKSRRVSKEETLRYPLRSLFYQTNPDDALESTRVQERGEQPGGLNPPFITVRLGPAARSIEPWCGQH